MMKKLYLAGLVVVMSMMTWGSSLNASEQCNETSAAALNDGDVFMLQCMGDTPDYRFLNGYTGGAGAGAVDLYTTLIDEHYSGTLWQCEIVEDDNSQEYVLLHCLGFGDNNDTKRYLDGNVHSNSVSMLAREKDPDHPKRILPAGIRWKVTSPENGYVQFTNQDEQPLKYLNGHTLNGYPDYRIVDLVDDEALSGTKWKIIKVSETNLGADNFINPIVNEGHDPWVIEDNGFYYYCFVRNNAIYVSKASKLQDIGKTTDVTCVYSPAPSEKEYHNIWAPELHCIDNIWYIIFSSGEFIKNEPNNNNYKTQRIRIISSYSPNLFSSQIPITFATNHFAIDGTFLKYNNELFLIWSGQPETNNNPKGDQQDLFIAKVTLTPTSIDSIGSPTIISSPIISSTSTPSWEEAIRPNGDGVVGIEEGPQVLRSPENDEVHIIYSASGSWTNNYCLGRLSLEQSSDPLLPASWTKHETGPVFKSGEGIAGPFGPGHASFVKIGDQHWIVYHCARYRSSGWTRWVQMQQFHWDGDTPLFGSPIPRLIPLTSP